MANRPAALRRKTSGRRERAAISSYLGGGEKKKGRERPWSHTTWTSWRKIPLRHSQDRREKSYICTGGREKRKDLPAMNFKSWDIRKEKRKRFFDHLTRSSRVKKGECLSEGKEKNIRRSRRKKGQESGHRAQEKSAEEESSPFFPGRGEI